MNDDTFVASSASTHHCWELVDDEIYTSIWKNRDAQSIKLAVISRIRLGLGYLWWATWKIPATKKEFLKGSTEDPPMTRWKLLAHFYANTCIRSSKKTQCNDKTT